MKENRKAHWENVYATKNPDQVSWTQHIPQVSLDLIHSFHLPKTAKIIDIGGGDSKLVDYLLEEGYEDITILDISATALEKAQSRLGSKSKQVKWIVSDITEFEPHEIYDVWHDRAAFHFLTTENQIDTYLNIAQIAISKYMVIGAFSENGPEKCSGLPIKQYSESQLVDQLSNYFTSIKCMNEDHVTPFKTIQNFLFCSFKRKIVI
ncbi:class I SAM-dependent methyltransferase [Mucilaginibacter sp. McL0603]|uniref:class I SAM-dependent methyltransferase n=1 Tax=Mucilaginibacter sp. McL0603 TaxID=3415670 RepID=UPI003CEA1E29